MILDVNKISKSYGSRKVLDGVSLQVKQGQLIGVVGENGAGKSTLLKIIVGEIKADSGSVNMLKSFGYCPQELHLIPDLTVAEHFEYLGVAYDMTETAITDEETELVNLFGFADYMDQPVKYLSGGSMQKLNLSLALMHSPNLLILDEPYNGFDWNTFNKFWEYSDQILEENKSILIVSHLINDKSRFDHIYNLNEQKLR